MGIETVHGHEFVNGIYGTGPGGKLTWDEMRVAAEIGELLGDTGDGRHRVAAAALGAISRATVPVSGYGSVPLWRSGNLPPVTASGIEPSALLAAPWPARFAAARTPSRAAAFEILTSYGSPNDPDEIAQALMDFAGDSDLQDYMRRSESARVAAMSDQQVSDALFAPVNELQGTAQDNPQGTGAADL